MSAPTCHCGKPCQQYSPKNFSEQCEDCNTCDSVNRRARSKRLREARRKLASPNPP